MEKNIHLQLRLYQKPKTVVVGIQADEDMLQGIIETSGGEGPGVDPDNPVDPNEPELSNSTSVWDV